MKPQEITQTPTAAQVSSLISLQLTKSLKEKKIKKKKKRFESRVSTRGITEFWMDIVQS